MTRTEVYFIQVFAGMGAFVLGALAIIACIKTVELKITEANIAAAETKPVVLISKNMSKSAQAVAMMDLYGEGK